MVRLMSGLGRRGARFEILLPGGIVVVRYQFSDQAGLGRRRREPHCFRDQGLQIGWRLPVAGKPVQGTGIGVVIARLPRRTPGSMLVPMCVNEPHRMFVIRITLMGVAERSLSKRQQQARDRAEMECPAHEPLLYQAPERRRVTPRATTRLAVFAPVP